MWSMPEQEFGYKIPNFARSLYDPFRIFYSPSFIITAKITAACCSPALALSAPMSIVYGLLSPTRIHHQVWPSAASIVLEFWEDSLPIYCIFVPLVDVRHARARPHHVVLDAGGGWIVVSVRIMHGSHAEIETTLHFLSQEQWGWRQSSIEYVAVDFTRQFNMIHPHMQRYWISQVILRLQ